jgi:hypothetical protein
MRLHRSFRHTDLNCMGHELSVFHRHGVDNDSVPDMQVAWRYRCAGFTKLRVGRDLHCDRGFRVGFNTDRFLRYPLSCKARQQWCVSSFLSFIDCAIWAWRLPYYLHAKSFVCVGSVSISPAFQLSRPSEEAARAFSSVIPAVRLRLHRISNQEGRWR